MIRTKKFKAENDEIDLRISIKARTSHLTKGESNMKFDGIIDKIIEALMHKFYFSEIKEIKN